MTGTAAGLLGAWLVIIAVYGIAITRRKRRAAQLYRRVVGHDVPGLVALLPPDLRDREFYRYMIFNEPPSVLRVGILYRTSVRYVGNPPNVGLEFDAESGDLIAVRPEGVGLGLK